LKEGEIRQSEVWNCVWTIGQRSFSELVLVVERIGSEAIVRGETKLKRVIGLDTHQSRIWSEESM